MTISAFFLNTNLLDSMPARPLRLLRIACVMAGFLLILLFTPALSAQTYADLFDFAGSSCCPQDPFLMAQGRDGNLYGNVASGGTNGQGFVFQITPTGTYKVLYNFDTTHGSTPIGGLALGVDGNLYGTTEEGGAHGFGNIFKITPSGTLTVLYDFQAGTDGGHPVSPLIVGLDGLFHGTSYPGMSYKISAAGVFHVVGSIPTTSYGPLLQTNAGTFYGVTEFGGTNSAGTVYKITGTTYKILHSFDMATGSYPVGGLVQGADGNFYGTTTAGGTTNARVIYRITPSGTYSVLVNFDGVHTAGGYQSYAGLIAGSDGNLYGATIWGGQYGYGVIFSLTTGGAYTPLYSFSAPTGDGAYTTPILHTNGELFGMTKRGGVSGGGVIYSFSDGIPRFVKLVNRAGTVGATVNILGTGFSTTSAVKLNGTPASFHVISDSYMTASVPSGETGFVTVTTSTATLQSSTFFKVTPQITGISPTTGKVGDSVVITGSGLIQTTAIKLGKGNVTSYAVNSDKQLTLTVPATATTGKITVTTPGGSAGSSAVFTVTP
ncbi:MAG TPA: choice-of-anchor tandem repeat GloVer-containing protein [Candidatus Sulfotelmatobacter sp.]|nr:choice-of-anchor tandem repeat GloVer-containing protein [Candidatus Sulfotelmatobacter sp.]